MTREGREGLATPPSRVRLAMGAKGVRIWSGDGPLPATFDGEQVHEYVPAAEAQKAAVIAIARAAHGIGWQAGVGGMETAGAIVSYLAQHQDQIEPFFAGKVSPVDWLDFTDGGCLTWHAAKGDRIIHPTEARAARRDREVAAAALRTAASLQEDEVGRG